MCVTRLHFAALLLGLAGCSPADPNPIPLSLNDVVSVAYIANARNGKAQMDAQPIEATNRAAIASLLVALNKAQRAQPHECRSTGRVEFRLASGGTVNVDLIPCHTAGRTDFATGGRAFTVDAEILRTALQALNFPMPVPAVDADWAPATQPASAASVASKDENNPAFHADLLGIAAVYREYLSVDDAIRWSPLNCSMPPTPTARMSASPQDETHGRKLYFLYVRDRDAYRTTAGTATAAPGQALVKESWHPSAVERDGSSIEWWAARESGLPPARPAMPGLEGATGAAESPIPETSVDAVLLVADPTFRFAPIRITHDSLSRNQNGDLTSYVHVSGPSQYKPYAIVNDVPFRADKLSGLFIMYKLDPATPGTDNGWVYGTVMPDRKSVTSAGRVRSCMNCHEATPHDRLFGLPLPPIEPGVTAPKRN